MRDNSYNNEVLHVVDYFNNSLIAKNDKIVNDVFNQKIAAQSKIDIGANRVTADKIYDLDKNILRENKEVNRSRIGINLLRIFGVCLAVAGAILILLAVLGPIPSLNTIWYSVGPACICVGSVLFALSWRVKKSYLINRSQLQELQETRLKEFTTASQQLADIKNHIYSDLTFSIFEQTYPLINFNRFFSETDYGNWTEWLKDDVNSSVLFCMSGNLKTNPFIILKTKSTEMYDHVYRGSKTVMVRRMRYVNNRPSFYMAPKVIIATTTNPAPRYWTATKLFFKSNAAESLNFQNMNEFKSEHKAEKYFKKDKNMEPMDNPEFDRYFPCQRDNEVQFRTLFSPLAQEEIIKLMKVKSDYLFTKHKTINIITSPSFENINFNVNYNNYQQEFDYSKIQAHFIEDNKLFFKDIYFMFAPILAIPLYQQYPYHQPIFEKTKQKLLAYSQNESIVNTMHNIDNFKHPQSVTDNILKTKRIFANDLCEINEIIAHGYRSSSRIVIVTVTDVEAGVVSVPVTVIDYFAVQKSTNVINSFVDHSAKDFDTNNSSFRSVWVNYAKTLNVSNVSKKGNFISMITNKNINSIDKKTYKDFLNKINNIAA